MGCFPQHLFFFLLSTAVFSVPQSATIYGPNWAKSLFGELKVTFELVHPYVIDYTAISQPTIQNLTSYLDAGAPVLVNSLDSLPPKSLVIPMFGFSLAVVYNVKIASLKLSQSALVDIFLGRISNWNHTNLTVLNPGTPLPDQPITIFTGSLLSRVVEGLSVFEGRTISSLEVSNNSFSVSNQVCSRVKTTPYSLGFTWLGDALDSHAQIAFIQNKEGFFATPSVGVATAMSEYFLLQKAAGNVTVQPHNMPGAFSYPLISLLYMVLPEQTSSCDSLLVVQHFVSLVMFQSDNVDLLCEVLGWAPSKSLSALDSPLGKVVVSYDYRDLLFGIECGTKDEVNYATVGTSSPLATFMLKMVAPYSAEIDPNIRLLSAASSITTYLDAMATGQGGVDIDMSFTWEPTVLQSYPELLSVPLFMGSVVPYVNFGGAPSPLLSVPVLVAIYSGLITWWNDTQIQALNPGVVLPQQPIAVYVAEVASIDGPTALFSSWLSSVSSTPFSWSLVNAAVPAENDVRLYIDYFPYSIGYSMGHFVTNATTTVPKLIGFNNEPISFSASSLAACWNSRTHAKCWPTAIPLVAVLRRPTDCLRQKRIVDFVDWILQRSRGLAEFLVPNLRSDETMGEAEYCAGRSLLVTKPEPQTLDSSAKLAFYGLAGIAMCFSVCQAIALGVARKRSELKSASVLFSLLAVVGVFFILLASLLIVQDEISTGKCGSAVWFLCFGFSLCYGSLFAKLFRLYAIFTTRKLVVPRLSNRRLLMIVAVFLALDLLLLVIYTIVTPAEPSEFSVLVPSSEDLVTGYREFTLEMCSFHVDSGVLRAILVFKGLVALGGAVMAFFIRQVDRRFSATSALGWAFYNMFLTIIVAVIFSVQFESNRLDSQLYIPVFCGLWIMLVTLAALTLDSNVLLACQDFSKPLRKMLNPKTSKESKDKKVSISGDPEPETDSKRSHSSTIFVVNREMFPSKYDDFSSELLDKILEELNFQRMAVRRAMASPTTVGTATTTVELADVGRQQSSKLDSPATRFNSKSKSGLAPPTEASFTTERSSSETPNQNGTQKPPDFPPEPLTKNYSNSASTQVSGEDD